MATPEHILRRLTLPARYEQLEEALGRDVVKLLTPPEVSVDSLNRLALATLQTGEGQLVPCAGGTGTGKTTLAENVAFFLPERFTQTLTHKGPIDFEALSEAVKKFRQKHAPTESQVIPINVDHREGAPPSDEELAAIKRFLRTAKSRCILLWLETNATRAAELSSRIAEITGKPVVDLPLQIDGPPRKAWQDIALNTIQLCNPLPSKQVPEIGIDPKSYDLSKYNSIGEFLRTLANDFTNVVADHEASTRKPVTLIVAFISESLDRGVLPSFTHGSEPGLLDSHALLNSTPDSMVGKKWAAKRGILTQTILRLDARAFWFPPAAVAAILRRQGPEDVVKLLSKTKKTAPSPADVHTYLARSDFGRYLAQERGAAYEMRGRPAEEARDALKAIAESYGFGHGHDKTLNRALLGALSDYAKEVGLGVRSSKAEESLEFCPSLLPDTQIELEDRILCLEYVWRSGEALSTSRRSEAAQYILDKLHNYAVNLGWTKP